jgi:hypothetical protein
MKTTVALLFVLCIGPLLLSAQSAPKHRLLFNRFRVAEIELMIADADGSNARPVVDHHESEYSPSLSLNGAWVAFTSERSGQPDIFRAHLDGSGVQQLTDDPAFDDQGALSPDGALLAFVSTRGKATPTSGCSTSRPTDCGTSPTAPPAIFARPGPPTENGSPSAPIAIRTPALCPATGSTCSPPASMS